MGQFRRLVITAGIAGIAAGLCLSVARQILILPLILEAEVYEHAAEREHAAANDRGATSHDHTAQAAPAEKEWEPADGIERNAWTWVANVLTGLGFGLLLVAAYVLSGRRLSLVRGVLWGLAGFATFSLVPAMGLPPALPGGPESPLGPRQLWWIAAVLCTAGGFALLAFVSGRWWRWTGIPLLALPFLIPAPRATEALAAPLVALTQRFIATTLAVNLASWLVLGALSGWLWARQSARIA